jgi:hypothetical protein
MLLLSGGWRTLGCVALWFVRSELQDLVQNVSVLLHPLLERADELAEVPAGMKNRLGLWRNLN